MLHNHFLTLLAFFFLISITNSARPKYATYSFPGQQKSVALTFDDGPHQILTPRLLDVLKKMNVKATFFVMGVKALMHPAILKRAVDEGHEIANHAFDHPVLSKISYDQVHDQIATTNTAITAAVDKIPLVMRPPYGNTNPKLNEYITKSEHLAVIMWSLDTQDWKRPTADELVSRTLKRIKPGDILLCHDIHPGTIEAMPKLIEGVLKKGLTFRTVSAMIGQSENNNTATATTNRLRH